MREVVEIDALDCLTLQIFCTLLDASCNRESSAYLGISINAEPGQGQVAVLGVGESSRHLG